MKIMFKMRGGLAPNINSQYQQFWHVNLVKSPGRWGYTEEIATPKQP
jgi:hypothetical protein